MTSGHIGNNMAALKALMEAIHQRDAYNDQFLATEPLPLYSPAPDGPRSDTAEKKQRRDALMRDRGEAYDRARAEAGRPDPHYPWASEPGRSA